MVAFTNHALDHLLGAVLTAKITKKIVRLGSRSSNPQVSEYSIEELERIVPKSQLHSSMSRDYKELKDINANLQHIISAITSEQITDQEIAQHVLMLYPDHYMHLESPPKWIASLYQLSFDDEASNGPWIEICN